jgi:hypothetical protein
MLKAPAERIGEEGQSIVPEFLQAWVQLMKAPARSFEQNRRDCLVRVKWLSAWLHRAQDERILAEIYWFRMQEMVDRPRTGRDAGGIDRAAGRNLNGENVKACE